MQLAGYIISGSIVLFITSLWIANRDILSLSIRNILRNYRRSIISLAAIGAAGIALVLLSGYINGLLWGLRESMIRSSVGHLQVQQEGYFDKSGNNSNEYIFSNYQDVIDAINANPELQEMIEDVTVVLRFSGIIMGEEETSIRYIGRGVDPEKEYIFANDDPIVQGAGLSKQYPYRVIVGEGLAAQLGVDIGGNTSIMSTTVYGMIDVLDATVGGVIAPLSKEYSDVILKVPISLAQSLIDTDGVNSIIIMLNKTIDVKRAKELVHNILQQNGWNELVVLPWSKLSEFYNAVKIWFFAFVYFIRIMLGIVVTFFILNTITMSVTERYAEIGTLRAIGNNKKEILQLFLSEGVILGVIGIAISLVVGLFLCTALSKSGVMLPTPPGMTREVPLTLVYYPENYLGLLDISIIIFIATFIASYIPAREASSKKIVDCLRAE